MPAKPTAKKPEEPRKVHPVPDAYRYLKHPENRAVLKSILREPVFIAAMNVLEEEARSSVGCLSAVPSEMVARQAAYHKGIGDVYNKLVDLCVVRESIPQEDAWDHLKPDLT